MPEWKYRKKHEKHGSQTNMYRKNKLSFQETYNSAHTPHSDTHTPVLHARVFPRGLLERDVAGGEGSEAAGDDGHGAELGPGLVHHVGAGGALLAVVSSIPPLQVVVRAGDGHLHG